MRVGGNAGRVLGFERMLFFSDAVFAIAITLLVLDLRLPPIHNDVLTLDEIVPKLVGFVVSFFVIAQYWLAHHRLFESVRDYDAPLLRANLLFLASIAFLPFPTSAVAELVGTSIAVVFYALSVAMVGLLLVMLTFVARRGPLRAEGATRGGTWAMVIRSLGAPLMFVATAVVAVHRPQLAMRLWLTLFIVLPLSGRLGTIVGRRIDARPAVVPNAGADAGT